MARRTVPRAGSAGPRPCAPAAPAFYRRYARGSGLHAARVCLRAVEQRHAPRGADCRCRAACSARQRKCRSDGAMKLIATLLQAEAAIVVFGGTFIALAVSYPAALLWRTLRALRTLVRRRTPVAPELSTRLVQYAARVRRRGFLALEDELPKLDDPFLARALSLIVDGAKAEELRHVLGTASESLVARDEQPSEVLEAAAGYAPTLGILGAVLGLIHVMQNLATPAHLGGGIAVAFVATVYGVGSANLVFLPLATRLRGLARERRQLRDVVIEGAVALQQGMHPRVLEAHLEGVASSNDRLRKAT